VLLQRLAYHAGAVSSRLTLRSLEDWPLPVTVETWSKIETAIRSHLHLGEGHVLWHLPPADQPQVKFGALLLDWRGTVEVFARVRLASPVPALTPRPSRPDRSPVSWPVRLAALDVAGASTEVTTVTPPGLHTPVHLSAAELEALCAEIQTALWTTRPAEVPAHWRPMHGDLAYWNLRRYRGNKVVLVDWEDAGWGPPHADLVRYLMTSPRGRQLANTLPSELRSQIAESSAFWLARFRVDTDAPSWVRRAHAEQMSTLREVFDV
jgi:hypothetical protein